VKAALTARLLDVAMLQRFNAYRAQQDNRKSLEEKQI
jgi:hypothetical protein